MARPISVIELDDQEKCELERRIKSPIASKQDHLRANIILLRAKGTKQADVASFLSVSIACVNKWSQRF